MRISGVMKEFINIKKQYENEGVALPISIQLEYENRLFIEEVQRTLVIYAEGNAIPKAGWIWFDSICEKQIADNVSEKYRQEVEIIVIEMENLKNDLLAEDGLLLEDGYTFSGKGENDFVKHVILLENCKHTKLSICREQKF